jgi:hypothetical protein
VRYGWPVAVAEPPRVSQLPAITGRDGGPTQLQRRLRLRTLGARGAVGWQYWLAEIPGYANFCQPAAEAVWGISDSPRTITSPLLQRRYRVNLIEHLQHDSVGGRLTVERDRQACPYYQRYIID